MDVLAMPRRAVDRSLRILRMPIDMTVGVLDREGNKASAFTLGLDRADATVRRFAGRILHDEPLQRDAQERGLAIKEREKALQLRTDAALRRRRADAEFEDNLETAQTQRAAAEQRADKLRASVDEQRRAESERLAEQTDQRRTASRDAADRTQQAIDERAQEAHLADLEKEAEVLEAREASVTTRSEAQRLQSALSEVKNNRRSG
jgi:hypothetical protein